MSSSRQWHVATDVQHTLKQSSHLSLGVTRGQDGRAPSKSILALEQVIGDFQESPGFATEWSQGVHGGAGEAGGLPP